ncbi:MAG: thioredoxin [Deltaproteobacteria bacterium]|nr:thioredoxin [Deltaproteobacteria bacterium]
MRKTDGRTAVRGLSLGAGLALSVFGCSNEPARSEPTPLPSTVPPPIAIARPEVVTPPAGTTDGPAFLRAEFQRARADGRTLLVDVGAPWCEPCRRFHAALVGGELDRDLPNVRFVEFDLEKHRPLVEAIGCHSKLVPLFARVNEDGTCGADRREGAVKGGRAIGFLLSRVKELVGSAATASP